MELSVSLAQLPVVPVGAGKYHDSLEIMLEAAPIVATRDLGWSAVSGGRPANHQFAWQSRIKPPPSPPVFRSVGSGESRLRYRPTSHSGSDARE